MSDALISLIPTYGPWIIFGIVALESAGVPLPGETILVAAALLAATTGQIKSPIDVSSPAIPRLPVSSSLVAIVPARIFDRRAYGPEELSSVIQKEFAHYLT